MNHTYNEVLDWLFSRLPMFQRIGPAAYRKDLTNIRALCQELGQPQDAFPCIHIAGTNGKGSVSHILAAILQASGLRVGLFTSPHYNDFRERIKINGEYISEEAVVDFVKRIESTVTRIKPSFFELTTAMGFDYFREQKIDVAIIETGLGGTYDSTNIVRPLLSVITNISYDHQQFLGDTLPQIAANKAGIIKQNTPVVVGETQPEVANVFIEKASTEKAPITFADRIFSITATQQNIDSQLLDIFKEDKIYLSAAKFGLLPHYQRRNLVTALQAIEQVKSRFNISEKQIRQGISDVFVLTRMIGRWQIIEYSPLTIVDSAHNEGGIRVAMQQLRQTPFEHLHFVIGTVSDKDLSLVLAQLPSQNATYYFCRPDIPRGLAATHLSLLAEPYGLKGQVYPSVAQALQAAQAAAHTDKDLVFVGGSCFVAAEALAIK